ncbi:MAG: NAD(P)/FAD-dependent oxidoreductase [Opitutales bacterium]
MKPITIAGGGVAGLAAGLALRQRGVPITVLEAGTYPRHRVCGEFLCGQGGAVLDALGLDDLHREGPRHRTTGWYVDGRCVLQADLPQPALGLSRHRLDARLAEAFQNVGGELRTQTRVDAGFGGEGQLRATGRALARSSDWLGLKLHVRGLRLAQDLEIHLGDGGYVGLSGVENGAVNACGLFRRRVLAGERGPALLLAYLRACGLGDLARRVEGAEPDPTSVVGVSHFAFGQSKATAAALGDALTLIPPFTGNGMSMALEAAWQAAPVLEDFAKGRAAWNATQTRLRQTLRRRFDRRVRWARGTQSLLLTRGSRAILSHWARMGAFPFQTLFRLTHS